MVELAPTQLDLVFHALADSTRRAIVQALAESKQPRRVSDLARPFRMSLAAVSKHLKVLEQAGLLIRRKRGTSHYLSLNPEALASAEEWLADYHRFWDDRLDELKHYLEQEENQ